MNTMNRILLVGAASALLALAAPRPAFAGGNLGFLLINGKGQSEVIIPDGPGSMNVSPGLNPSNYASGTIGEFIDKHGKSHAVFHGTLFGMPDPRPTKEGWGFASLVSDIDSIPRDYALVSATFGMAVNHVAGGELVCPPGLALQFESISTILDAMIAKVNASGIPASRKAEHTNAANQFRSSAQGMADTLNEILFNPALTPEEISGLIKKFKKFKKKHKKARKRLAFLLRELMDCDLIIEVVPT